jgi:hypothetical protein
MADLSGILSFEDALTMGDVRACCLCFPDGRGMRIDSSLLMMASPVLESILVDATGGSCSHKRRRLDDGPCDEAPYFELHVSIRRGFGVR